MNWPMFAGGAPSTPLHEMIQRLNVERGKLAQLQGGDAYAEARARCPLCGTSDRCLRWLDDAAQSGTRPEFCPNLPVLEACARTSSRTRRRMSLLRCSCCSSASSRARMQYFCATLLASAGE